jgi:hypothetical protein
LYLIYTGMPRAWATAGAGIADAGTPCGEGPLAVSRSAAVARTDVWYQPSLMWSSAITDMVVSHN